MNPIIDLLQRAKGTIFVNEDGIETPFKLLPPVTQPELEELQARVPCPIPPEMLEVFQFARGFEGPLESVDFCGNSWGGFGLEELVPHTIDLTGDGFGNFWIVDLTPESTTWGPILYACHDAPVLVYQSDSLPHFVEEVLRFGHSPWKGEIDDVHEALSTRIWKDNPGVLARAECLLRGDADLQEFASELDDSWFIVDMRTAKIGDGFSWGRYGPRTPIKRFGTKRVFAYQKKKPLQRFLDRLR